MMCIEYGVVIYQSNMRSELLGAPRRSLKWIDEWWAVSLRGHVGLV
jgi:hypothetical protein